MSSENKILKEKIRDLEAKLSNGNDSIDVELLKKRVEDAEKFSTRLKEVCKNIH